MIRFYWYCGVFFLLRQYFISVRSGSLSIPPCLPKLYRLLPFPQLSHAHMLLHVPQQFVCLCPSPALWLSPSLGGWWFINHLIGFMSASLSVKSAERVRRWHKLRCNTSVAWKGVCECVCMRACDHSFSIMSKACNRCSSRAILTPEQCQRGSWEFYIIQALLARDTRFPKVV